MRILFRKIPEMLVISFEEVRRKNTHPFAVLDPRTDSMHSRDTQKTIKFGFVIIDIIEIMRERFLAKDSI